MNPEIKLNIKYEWQEAPILSTFYTMGEVVEHLQTVDNAVWFEFVNEGDQSVYEHVLSVLDAIDKAGNL